MPSPAIILDKIDAQGRDAWFYTLSNLEYYFPDGAKEKNLTAALVTQPPKVDIRGRGWVDATLIPSEEELRPATKEGWQNLKNSLNLLRQVAVPRVAEKLQPVLTLGSPEQQRRLLSELLNPPDNPDNVGVI